jgi:hypothetical protein
VCVALTVVKGNGISDKLSIVEIVARTCACVWLLLCVKGNGISDKLGTVDIVVCAFVCVCVAIISLKWKRNKRQAWHC